MASLQSVRPRYCDERPIPGQSKEQSDTCLELERNIARSETKRPHLGMARRKQLLDSLFKDYLITLQPGYHQFDCTISQPVGENRKYGEWAR